MYSIKWYKYNPAAKIPTKDPENAGFDVYSILDGVVVPPHGVRLIPTGICQAPGENSEAYWLQVSDRGSTGSLGIHSLCGVIDHGYRGEIFIALGNFTDRPFVITSKVDKVDVTNHYAIRYTFAKAIAQLILIPQPEVESGEVNQEEWEELFAHNSKRGLGKLGSSGK